MVWPQDKAADVHDLLEARHHLLQAGDTEAADEITENGMRQLHTWGAWDQEASLIYDLLGGSCRLSTTSNLDSLLTSLNLASAAEATTRPPAGNPSAP